MSSNYFVFYCRLSSWPQSFPASRSFPMSQLFASGGQSIGASASASVLPMYSQYWFPLELAGVISLLQGILKSLAPQFESINSSPLSLLYGPTLTSEHDYWKKKNSFDYRDLCLKVMSLLFNMLSRFVMGLPHGSTVKTSACNAGIEGDMSLIPALGRSSRGGHGIALQYSCLEHPMDRVAWLATVYGVVSWTDSNTTEAT